MACADLGIPWDTAKLWLNTMKPLAQHVRIKTREIVALCAVYGITVTVSGSQVSVEAVHENDLEVLERQDLKFRQKL